MRGAAYCQLQLRKGVHLLLCRSSRSCSWWRVNGACARKGRLRMGGWRRRREKESDEVLKEPSGMTLYFPFSLDEHLHDPYLMFTWFIWDDCLKEKKKKKREERKVQARRKLETLARPLERRGSVIIRNFTIEMCLRWLYNSTSAWLSLSIV